MFLAQSSELHYNTEHTRSITHLLVVTAWSPSPSQPVIFGNLASSMRVVTTNMDKLGIPFANQANKDNAQAILNLSTSLSSFQSLPPEMAEAFKSLWSDGGVRECFKRAYEFQLNDSAP